MHEVGAADLAALLTMLRDRLRIGDTVLTGGSDPISRIIQIGSRSPYSHAAIMTGEDELTEAYDYALTPDEGDEGIFHTAMEDFLKRTGLRRVLVLRPVDADPGRIQEAAAHFRDHSPGFPTVGMFFLALCGASGPLLRLLPGGLQHRSTMRQVRLAADGTRRMHCAETVARIYLAAGLAVRFRSPRLQHHIEHLSDSAKQSDPLTIPEQPRVATAGCWPGQRGVWSIGEQVDYAVRSAVETWRERSQAADDFDVTDLLLPGDFARAEPFETVVHMVHHRSGWEEVPLLSPLDMEPMAQVPPTPLASRSA